MTIIHIISHFDLGGAERVAVNLAKSTGGDVHIVEVVRSDSDYSRHLVSECLESGISIHRSDSIGNKAGIFSFPGRFNKILNQCKPDIIHVHTEVPDLALYLYMITHHKKIRAIKIIRTIHNTQLWTRWKVVGTFVESWYQKIHANISISQAVSESYQKEWHSTPEKLIYNGLPEIEQEDFKSIVKDKINVLFAGRLEPYKGISVLIDIIKSNPDIEFHVCGSGSMRTLLQQEISKAGNVHLYDAIPSLAAKMSNFDFLFMPSHFEGLALCSIEASLAGCPVIANNCPGLGETLPPDWPLLVIGNSVSEYQVIFSQLGKINGKSLAKRAQGFAREHFSLDTMVRKYMQIYNGD